MGVGSKKDAVVMTPIVFQITEVDSRTRALNNFFHIGSLGKFCRRVNDIFDSLKENLG